MCAVAQHGSGKSCWSHLVRDTRIQWSLPLRIPGFVLIFNLTEHGKFCSNQRLISSRSNLFCTISPLCSIIFCFPGHVPCPRVARVYLTSIRLLMWLSLIRIPKASCSNTYNPYFCFQLLIFKIITTKPHNFFFLHGNKSWFLQLWPLVRPASVSRWARRQGYRNPEEPVWF